MLKFWQQKKKLRHPAGARLLHWVLVPILVVKLMSGWYITRPGRQTGFHSMDTARKTHFMASYLFTSYFVARVYYSLATRDFRYLLPTRRDFNPRAAQFLRYELFRTTKQPKFPKYNVFQKMVFTSWLVLFPLQILTGYALYDTRRSQSIVRFLGGLNKVRQVHYLATVAIASTIFGHLYFALTESKEKVKSIFTGYYREE